MPSRDCGHGSSTRPCTRRLRFAHAPLQETPFDIVFIANHGQLNIHSLSECWIPLYFSRALLPVRTEPCHQYNEVRIAHRNRNSSYFSECSLNCRFTAHLRHSHCSLKFERVLVARLQGTSLQSRTGSDYNRLPPIGRA